MKRLANLLAIMMLVLPSSPVTAETITADVCGGGEVRVSIPVRHPLPGETGDHGCCKKGCHAANERRKKADGTAEDGCC